LLQAHQMCGARFRMLKSVKLFFVCFFFKARLNHWSCQMFAVGMDVHEYDALCVFQVRPRCCHLWATTLPPPHHPSPPPAPSPTLDHRGTGTIATPSSKASSAPTPTRPQRPSLASRSTCRGKTRTWWAPSLQPATPSHRSITHDHRWLTPSHPVQQEGAGWGTVPPRAVSVQRDPCMWTSIAKQSPTPTDRPAQQAEWLTTI
jgi:hypothetical protein